MTREEAMKWLIRPIVSSTEIGEFKAKELKAYELAIEALSEPKTGKWILTPMLSDNYRYKCSICNSHHRERYDYCPSCGKRML